jgi:Lon protease-like protein
VFPLPNVVLFPHAVMSLHIFELRYRTMVRDALSGERMIALALLQPGWESVDGGNGGFFPLGCLARFEEVEWLTNDCFDLKVLGLSRVRFQRVVREFPYRSARLELLPQAPYTEDDPLVEIEKRALLDVCERWRAATQTAADPGPSPWSREVPYETLVNVMCMVTDCPPLEKLGLLELDSVLERGRRIRERTELRLRRPEVRVPPGGEQN